MMSLFQKMYSPEVPSELLEKLVMLRHRCILIYTDFLFRSLCLKTFYYWIDLNNNEVFRMLTDFLNKS